VSKLGANEGDIVRIAPKHRCGRKKKDVERHEHYSNAWVHSSEFGRRHYSAEMLLQSIEVCTLSCSF
jgi:hypothetical protein